MRHAYLAGLRSARDHWPVVAILFLASIAAALAFGAAAWLWLSLSLDKSLATRSLLSDLSVQVLIDLFIHHHKSFLMLLVSGVAMVGCFALLGIWLNGVAIAAVSDEGSLSACVVRGLRTYPTYLGLAALVGVLQGAALGASFFVDRGLTRWATESASEMIPYWIVAISAVLDGAAVFFLTTVHDHARIRVTRTGVGALPAFRWAFALVGHRDRRVLPLALALLSSSLLLWLVYQGVARWIPTRSALGVTLSLLWGEVFLLLRMFTRVWWFAAETQLQRAGEGAGGYRVQG